MENLKDAEAKLLLTIEKLVLDNHIDLPTQGKRDVIDLYKADEELNILKIDLNSSSKRSDKYTFNCRYNNGVIIFRIDINGTTHCNPDGTCLNGTHMHIYKEGFNDAYAIPLPDSFGDIGDFVNLLYEILKYSNVINLDSVEITMQGDLLGYGTV